MPLRPLGPKTTSTGSTGGAVVADRQPPRVSDKHTTPVTHTSVDSYKPIGLPVTTLSADLSLKGNQVQVGQHAPPRPVLAMEEIRLAPADTRRGLVRRFASQLSFIAGRQLGATSASSPAEGTAKAGPWSLTSQNGQVTVSHQGGQSMTFNAATQLKPADKERAREMLVDAFSHLLAKRGDPKAEKVAASSYLFVMGASGVLGMQGRVKPTREGMHTPKLLAWDFNGTVQGDNGRFRPGMAATVEALKRMGAMNVLTTSIAPEPAELAMGKANIHFDAHFGNGEVRPNSGSKQYEPVADVFGLSADASRDCMVTIGDSTTDISGDKAAGLFIHDRFMMPGPAIEQLLLELDRLGHGSFIEGLEVALGGKSLDTTQTLRFGALQFDVSLRPGNADKGGRAVPVIDRLKIMLDPLETAGILGGATPGALEDSSQWRLAYEHLAATLDEQLVPVALRNVKGDPAAAKEAVERRLEERAVDVAEAKKAAAGLGEWLAGPVDFESAQGQLTDLARVGDPEVSRAVKAAVQSFAADSAKAEAKALGDVAKQSRALDALLSTSAVVFDPSAQLTRADVKLIKRALDKPEVLFAKHEDALVALSKLTGDDPEILAVKQQLRASLPEAAARFRGAIAELFGERKAKAAELLPLDALATDTAKTRPAAFAKISEALAAL